MPDVDGLVQFLVTEKGFKYAPVSMSHTMRTHCSCHTSEERVRKGAEKLAKYLNSKQQGRLDGFFSVVPKTSPKKGESKDAKGKGKGKGDAKGTKRKVRALHAIAVQRRFLISGYHLGGRQERGERE